MNMTDLFAKSFEGDSPENCMSPGWTPGSKDWERMLGVCGFVNFPKNPLKKMFPKSFKEIDAIRQIYDGLKQLERGGKNYKIFSGDYKEVSNRFNTVLKGKSGKFKQSVYRAFFVLSDEAEALKSSSPKKKITRRGGGGRLLSKSSTPSPVGYSGCSIEDDCLFGECPKPVLPVEEQKPVLPVEEQKPVVSDHPPVVSVKKSPSVVKAKDEVPDNWDDVSDSGEE